MKILLNKSTIDINELKELKKDNKVTYNPNEANIDLIIEDDTLYFKNYKEYSIDYTHWMEHASLSYVVELLEETLSELSSMNF